VGLTTDAQEEEILSMRNLVKLGVASLLAAASASASLGEDVKANANAAANKPAGTSVDATATGSVNASYGSLISNIQAGKSADLTAFNAASTVDCVKVSTLQGGGDAQALDNAISKNQSALTTWQGELDDNMDFMAKVKASCSLSADADVSDILAIESGTDGAFTVYFDDRS
jgi:hypothetical protein